MSDAPATSDIPVAPPTIVEPTADMPEQAAESKTTETPVAAPDTESAPAAAVDGTTDTVDQAALAASSATTQHGKLGFKSGFMGYFLKKKKYFWLGDEPVSYEKLGSYLRGEKPEVAHPTAAWSTHTGKGLLYYAKDETKKSSPDGVMNLAEISDLKTEGTAAISFMLYKHKQTLECTNIKARDAWFKALEKESEIAKAAKEHITSSDTFKETMAHLEKPAGGLAVAGAAVGSSRSKSAEPKSAEAVSKDTASESSDKKTPTKDKSRSVSRKRHSLFGGLLGKKDEAEETPAATEEAVVPVATTDGTTEAKAVAAETAPVDSAETSKAVTETPATEKAKTPRSSSKSGKRSSVFGLFGKKDATGTNTEASAAEETTPAATDAPVETSTSEVAPAHEAAPEGIAIATSTDVPVAEQMKEPESAAQEEVAEPSATAAVATTEPAEKRKSSFFGLMKEKTPAAATTAATSEEQKPKSSIPSKLGGLFRSSSKAGKTTKEAKEPSPPPTVVESSEAPPTIPAPAEQKPLDEATEAPTAIGDVVPDAVSTGTAQPLPQPVSAAA